MLPSSTDGYTIRQLVTCLNPHSGNLSISSFTHNVPVCSCSKRRFNSESGIAKFYITHKNNILHLTKLRFQPFTPTANRSPLPIGFTFQSVSLSGKTLPRLARIFKVRQADDAILLAPEPRQPRPCSGDGGTPKWIVYNGTNPIYTWMI